MGRTYNMPAEETVNTGADSSDAPSKQDLMSYLDGTGLEFAADDPVTLGTGEEAESEETQAVEQEAEGQDTAEPQDASEGGTLAGDQRSKFIPRERFDEVNAKRQEAERRAEERARYDPWAPVLDRLQSVATPEEVLQQLEQLESQSAPPAAQPAATESSAPADELTDEVLAERYAATLAEVGVEATDLEPDVYWAGRRAFDRAERANSALEAFHRQQEQARQDAAQRSAAEAFQAEMKAVQDAHPEFADQTAQMALAAFSLGTNKPLRAAAEELLKVFKVNSRNALADDALNNKRPVPRPAPASGAAPSPAVKPDYANMSPDEFRAAVARRL